MKEVIKHIDFIINHTQETIYHFDKQKVNRVPFFCLGLLERLNASSKGLKVLLEHIDKDEYLEYSAGLIIRTTILDFLFTLKGYALHEENRQKQKSFEESERLLEKYCNEVFTDGIRHALEHIKKLNDKKVLSNAEMEKYYRNIGDNHPSLTDPYKEDGKPPKLKTNNKHSAGSIFFSLVDHHLSKLAFNHDIYLTYSKYEHFSILYYDLIRMPFEQKKENIKSAVSLFALHNFLTCSLLLDFNDSLFQHMQHRSIGQYIELEILKLPPNSLTY